MVEKNKLDEDLHETPVDATLYRGMIGSLMYLKSSRPDLIYAVYICARYQEKPTEKHLNTVKRIFRYLKGTINMGLSYLKDINMSLTAYSDADHAGCQDIRRVDWKSKKQTTIAMHSAQAEYVAASEAAIEAVWISKFFGDLGVMPSINKLINMFCDNSAAIIFTNELGIMKGARHFLRIYHYIREQVETGKIKLIKVHTDDNLADPFTKALPRGMVIDHAK
nr:hypothetical protein [Tanacetum cinerariifolium]